MLELTMNLHLLVPALFWPDTGLPDIYRDLSLPALENLVAKCSSDEDESEGLEAWLCRAFGVAKQQDWPVAPLTLLVDGTEDIKAGNDYWIRADPVHLHIERDQIVLADSRVFSISSQEAEAFTGTLNRHFAASGQELVFLPLRPDRWYMRVTKTPAAKTHLLHEAANRGINDLLPFGVNQTFWRGLFNEIQMLLHSHPLNESREANGEPVVNSTWFWGGGTMPESLNSPYTRIWSNNVLARSLALASRTDHMPLPASSGIWQQSATSGHHLVVLDALYGKAQYADAFGWREGLKELERSWFKPLWAMSRQGLFDRITLTALDGARSKNFTARRVDLRKFWRRPKPISIYAG
jgi:hypothetical protein